MYGPSLSCMYVHIYVLTLIAPFPAGPRVRSYQNGAKHLCWRQRQYIDDNKIWKTLRKLTSFFGHTECFQIQTGKQQPKRTGNQHDSDRPSHHRHLESRRPHDGQKSSRRSIQARLFVCRQDGFLCQGCWESFWIGMFIYKFINLFFVHDWLTVLKQSKKFFALPFDEKAKYRILPNVCLVYIVCCFHPREGILMRYLSQ